MADSDRREQQNTSKEVLIFEKYDNTFKKGLFLFKKKFMKSVIRLVAITVFTLFFTESDAQVLVSSRKPNGLAVSTGNLYFTSHDAAGAAVWRTSQSSVPGREGILYWEAGAKFGDIVFTKVGTSFFGYFFAEKAGVITIRRVSLSGGNATILATVTNIDIINSHHNLVTDGVNLYWQDVNSIRKMSINGGEITVLDGTRSNTPTAGIDLQNDRIIYADVDAIRFVPTAGAITNPELRTIVPRSSGITTLHVGESHIYWGERNGSVRRKASGSSPQTLQGPGSFTPTSIGTSGSKFAWTQCGSASCQLKRSFGLTLTIGVNALGLFITSAGNIFWGDDAGVHRRPF